MNGHLTGLLYRRYPRLYRGRCLGIQESLMSWGFCCGDGWFDLLDQLSADIEAECKKMIAEGYSEDELPIATQVKEKFGSLRFHLNQRPLPPAIKELIERARIDSESIPEDMTGTS